MDNNDKEKEILKYVSNMDKNIYSVYNLPEEIIAVIFAYVSRSPKSFRENLMKVTEEKASEFHEKWVLNFGHASVAELAVAHMCVEKVSRLFSSILERANLFISPIEYSQRYQKPKRGNFYIPKELSKFPELKSEYIQYNNLAYDIYEELYNKLFKFHINNNDREPQESDKEFKSKWEKIAFEDARYVLPLSVLTNLGFTANGRALENLIMKLLSSKYPEVRERGNEIKKEAIKVLPTLVKYAEENDYYKSLHKDILDKEFINSNMSDENPDDIVLLDCDYQDSEINAIIKILTSVISIQKGITHQSIKNYLTSLKDDQLISLFNKLTSKLGIYDEPWDVFHQIKYNFELYISEASWHQLLRHRKCDFYYSDPSVYNGLTIPPAISHADLQEHIYRISDISENLYYKILDLKGYEYISSYVVLNAHKRRITATIDLWELYNIINLRLTPHAQWDIKTIVKKITEKISNIHPNIISHALSRVNKKNKHS